MILRLEDHEGDPIAVESAEIIGLSVGTISGTVRLNDPKSIVTLIWARGIGQPFMVAAPFDEVLALWQGARLGRGPHGETLEEMRAAPPGVFPLVVHQHPELLP